MVKITIEEAVMRKGIRVVLLALLVIMLVSSFSVSSVAASLDTSGMDSASQIIDGTYGSTGQYSYKVYLPAGYDESNWRYPVTYLMPFDGLSSSRYINDGIKARLDNLMATDQIMQMIVVMPEFSSSDNFRTVLRDTLVPHIDANYRTVSNATMRGVLGVGVGGYMAYIMGFTTNTSALINLASGPVTFLAIGSHMGDFTPMTQPGGGTSYGNVSTLLGNATFTGANMRRFYTYIDAPTGDPKTLQANQSGAIVDRFLQQGGSTLSNNELNEYVLLPGNADTAYYMANLGRSLNVFSNGFINGALVTTPAAQVSSYRITPQAVSSSVTSFNIDYRVNVAAKASGLIYDVQQGTTPMDVKVTVNLRTPLVASDPTSYAVIYSESKVISNAALGAADVSGSFTISTDKLHSGISTTAEVLVNILGKDISLGTKPIVRVQTTGSVPDEQLIDLMGDWKFRAYKTGNAANPMDNINAVTAGWANGDYNSWGTVQPGLTWWTADFDSSLNNNANFGGHAWYIRDFYVPADFPTQGLLLSGGQIDETDIMYVNGHFVGTTGYNISGGTNAPPGTTSNPWDVERYYPIDSSFLNYGQTNTIYVRMYNSSGGGGWYNGPIGIYSQASLNKALGLPSDVAPASPSTAVKNAVAAQAALLANGNLTGFAATVDPEFFHSGKNKERYVSQFSNWLATYDSLVITDNAPIVFTSGSSYMYQADRTITGKKSGSPDAILFSGQVQDYYRIEHGLVLQYGDHSRFYADTIYSPTANYQMLHRVYLPEGYYESNKRYPVVYLMHQINSTSKSYEIDKINLILDREIAAGNMAEVILVLPDSISRTSWTTSNMPNAVANDLVSFVDQNYRTIPDARFRGTAGASLGGGAAYNIGIANPNKFSSIVSFFGANITTTPVTGNSLNFLNRYSLWFISGNRDVFGFGRPVVALATALQAKGVDEFFYLIENGAHDSLFYIPYFDDAMIYTSDHFDKSRVSQSASSDVSGTVSSEHNADGSVSLAVSMSASGIGKYLEVVPASSVTTNQNPPLVIPYTVSIIQGGKVVYEKTFYKQTMSAGQWQESLTVGSDAIDSAKDYEIRLYASVLDKTFTVFSFYNSTLGDVPAFKFYDSDADGVYDEGADTPIQGWKIEILNDEDAVVDVKNTDANGLVNFTVPNGEYTIREVMPTDEPCWIATTATSQAVTVVRMETADRVEFGNICDEVAPVFDQLTVTPNILWPANHKYVDVTTTVFVSDNFDPNPTVTLVSVTSNEPDDAIGNGDGNTIDDVVVVDNFHFKLRAERAAQGTGRVYTITYRAADAYGNSSIQSIVVTVPLNAPNK